MAEYLATGRNPQGKKVTERVDVESADEAMKVLRDRGYDEIVLHTDDIGARYTKQSAVANVISPRQYLWLSRMPAPVAQFLILTLNTYKRSWYTYFGAGALIVYRISTGAVWGSFDTILVLILIFPVLLFPLPIFLAFFSAGTRYRRLIDSVSWGRWEEVLDRADSVGRALPPEEAAFQKAKALSGLGRLDEGLRLVEPFSDGVKIPASTYWSRLASVYSAGQHPDESQAAMARALELAPENATFLVDIADSEVWLRRNPGRARELLARARKHALSDHVQMFVLKTEGWILLEEGRPREASELLSQALKKALAWRHASPLMGVTIDKIHAGLALAHAAEGDLETARVYFKKARPRLVALKYHSQLERCEMALGEK